MLEQNRLEPVLSERRDPAPAGPNAPPTFSADGSDGADLIGNQAILIPLAELVVHQRTQTPMTIGLFGPAGCGKSHFLHRLIAQIKSLAANAAQRPRSPLTSDLAIVELSASALHGDPTTGIATALYESLALAGNAQPGLAAAAGNAIHAATDPKAAARDAAQRLDESRRSLDVERRSLEALDGKRARLVETVLYETAGSRIDAYARANRARIDARLRSFGFSGEPVQTYKDLVRDFAEQNGLSSRIAIFVRSLWAYSGQITLIVWAIIFCLAAWGLGLASETRATWIPALRNATTTLAPAADWLELHADWLVTLKTAAIVIGALCLARNIWRAIRFLGPLLRGAGLLRGDIETRRRLLDGELAHQTKRVDALSAEVDAQARSLEDAERRAIETTRSGAPTTEILPFNVDGDSNGLRKARAFVRALLDGLKPASAMAGEKQTRLLVTIDDLERVPAERAAAIIGAAYDLLASQNVVLALAIDPEQLVPIWGSATATMTQLERFVQVPVALDTGPDQETLRMLAKGLLGSPQSAAPIAIDASQSCLDEPLTDQEAALLSTLAPLAGTTARRLKRFINLYRLARQRTNDRPTLALMLALDLGGTSGELAAVGAAMDSDDRFGALRIHPGEARLQNAVQAVAVARGRAIDVDTALTAWRIARDYRFPI